MSILIEGYVPNSNIVPIVTEYAVSGTPGGLSGTIPGNLVYEADNLNVAIQFDGTEAEDVIAKFQVGLDGVLVPGGIYRTWILARETGSGNSWNTKSIDALLSSSGGKGGPYLPSNYGTLWSGTALTGTYKWFSVTQHLLTEDGESAPNSLLIKAYRHEPGLATKRLELDAIIVEELAGA